MEMQTCQIRLTGKQLKALDSLVQKGIYPNRSEAVRDAVRHMLEKKPRKKKKKR